MGTNTGAKRFWPGIGSLSDFAGAVAAELVAVAAADARGTRRAGGRAISEPVGPGAGLGEHVQQGQSGWLDSPGRVEIHDRDEFTGGRGRRPENDGTRTGEV